MFLLFIIGFLLVFLSFYSFSKIEEKCVTPSLRTKLKIALGIGSTLISLGLGFFICINNSNCKCSFSNNIQKSEIYGLLVFSIISGIGLLILTLGINSDLKDPNCNVDLGVLPLLLGGIAFLQLLFSIIYIIYIIKSPNWGTFTQGKKKQVSDEQVSDKQVSDEQVSDEERSALYEAEKEASITVQKRILNTQIKEKELDLTKTKESILRARHSKKDPKQSDIAKVSKLTKEIFSSKRDLEDVSKGFSSSDNYSSASASSSA